MCKYTLKSTGKLIYAPTRLISISKTHLRYNIRVFE